MSGAILNVIYGIPLCNEHASDIRRHSDRSMPSEELLEYIEDSDGCGFVSLYSAYGDAPRYFGVEICELEEHGVVEMSDKVSMSATETHIAKYNKFFNALEPEIQEELTRLDPNPRVFLLWSSS